MSYEAAMSDQLVQQIEKLIEDSSFRSWCLGNASDQVSRYWVNRIAENASRQKAAHIAKRIVLQLNKNSCSDLEKHAAWEKLAQRINIESEIRELSDSPLSKSRRPVGWVFAVAASLALMVITFLALEYTTLITPPAAEEPIPEAPEWLMTSTDYGENKIITLDNGTKITLNANTSVIYAKGWIVADTVNIKLDGEAYFDVTKRKVPVDPVFQVETADGSVNVLGTRFMVTTWDDRTRVVLEEGEVAINKKADATASPDAILKPNERAEFSLSTKEVNIEYVNTELFTSWTKGLFVFDRTPLITVANRIEKTFGKEVIIADPALLTHKVSGSVESHDVEVITSAVAKTLQISVVHNEEQIVFENAILGPTPFN